MRRATLLALTALPILTALAMPEAAHAAVSPVASAFAAYGPPSVSCSSASLTTEKFLIKPELTEEEAKGLVADSVYGIAGVLVLRGYLHVTQYGKGWEFLPRALLGQDGSLLRHGFLLPLPAHEDHPDK